VLESTGFRPVARQRSREVTLYRQGSMNLVVNSPGDAFVSGTVEGQDVLHKSAPLPLWTRQAATV
jgi:4-hydroxyphenylpyruvate dioxygenase